MSTCPWPRGVIMRARDEGGSRLVEGERTREGVPSLEGETVLPRLAWRPPRALGRAQGWSRCLLDSALGSREGSALKHSRRAG